MLVLTEAAVGRLPRLSWQRCRVLGRQRALRCRMRNTCVAVRQSGQLGKTLMGKRSMGSLLVKEIGLARACCRAGTANGGTKRQLRPRACALGGRHRRAWTTIAPHVIMRGLVLEAQAQQFPHARVMLRGCHYSLPYPYATCPPQVNLLASSSTDLRVSASAASLASMAEQQGQGQGHG